VVCRRTDRRHQNRPSVTSDETRFLQFVTGLDTGNFFVSLIQPLREALPQVRRLLVALERRMLGGGTTTIIVWDLWWAGDVALDQVCVPPSPMPIIIQPLQNPYLSHYFNRQLSAAPFCHFDQRINVAHTDDCPNVVVQRREVTNDSCQMK